MLSYIAPEKKSALLRFSNDNARIGANELTINGIEYIYIPQTPIADITTDTAWLYSAIAKHLIIDKYSAYGVISEIPVERNESRKVVTRAKSKLIIIKLNNYNANCFQSNLSRLFSKKRLSIENIVSIY